MTISLISPKNKDVSVRKKKNASLEIITFTRQGLTGFSGTIRKRNFYGY